MERRFQISDVKGEGQRVSAWWEVTWGTFGLKMLNLRSGTFGDIRGHLMGYCWKGVVGYSAGGRNHVCKMLGHCGRVFGEVSREILGEKDRVAGFDLGVKWVEKAGLHSDGARESNGAMKGESGCAWHSGARCDDHVPIDHLYPRSWLPQRIKKDAASKYTVEALRPLRTH
jgi:hypothetical protein